MGAERTSLSTEDTAESLFRMVAADSYQYRL